MENKSNIVLIGMSGAGKSTLGVLLAKALGKSFTDTDIMIQQREGRLLQDIIDTDGVEYFLDAEEAAVCSVKLTDTVIATGGSVVYSDKVMEKLCADGVCVYLHVDFEELSVRLGNITSRGIVFKNAGTLREVYEERLPLYEKYAHVTVKCSGKGIEECVNEIVTVIQKERT